MKRSPRASPTQSQAVTKVEVSPSVIEFWHTETKGNKWRDRKEREKKRSRQFGKLFFFFLTLQIV